MTNSTIAENLSAAAPADSSPPPLSPGLTLHALVEQQAAQTPDSVAVVFEDRRMTYGELNTRSTQLARHLNGEMRVAPGDLVGLILNRSERMVVAILAVLKAGAGYVPIDPRHPRDTVGYMIENAAVRALIAESDTVAAAAANYRGELCVLDIEFDDIGYDDIEYDDTETANPAAPDSRGSNPGRDNQLRESSDDAPEDAAASLAYVIYTSGSTGRPKGVAVEHRAIVNTILWRNRFYGMDQADAALQIPSYAFDSSVLDIFCALTTGGRLVIPDEDLRLDARYVRALIETHGVTRFIATPSYYSVLNRELKGVRSLRSVTVAGEAATLELAAAHHRNLPGTRLINEYGPTENAVCSTACELAPGLDQISIGRPIANTQVWILDDRLQPVPVGEAGEIYLAGAGLARGYLGQPELTRERFLPNPFPPSETDSPANLRMYKPRMYKTGDRGRWTAEGTVEFLGRMDRQVKLRGFRIELPEIEHVLGQHGGVEAAAVLCKRSGDGDPYLAAYVSASAPLADGELMTWAKAKLPHYMIPSTLRVLPRLPLTLNGKVDLDALDRLADAGQTNPEQPGGATGLEQSLRNLCAAVLQQNHIGLDENFFQLGANSLRVMELVNRIRGGLEREVGLLDVYSFPTVRGLAARLASDGLEPEPLDLPDVAAQSAVANSAAVKTVPMR